MGQREAQGKSYKVAVGTRWAFFTPCTQTGVEKGSSHIVGASEWVWLGS